jgi:hypothetical protein
MRFAELMSNLDFIILGYQSILKALTCHNSRIKCIEGVAQTILSRIVLKEIEQLCLYQNLHCLICLVRNQISKSNSEQCRS